MPATIKDIRPDWVKPENASVLDSPVTKAIRILAGLVGAGDPQAPVMGMMAPMEAGPSGGLVDAVKSLISGARELPKPLGSLAKTLDKTGERGVYALKPSVGERVRNFYDLGGQQPSASNWAGVTDELANAFGGDQNLARTWSRLWGATSPNTSVPVNTRESIAALVHALTNDSRPLTVPEAQTLSHAKITMAPSKVPNINRALAGEPLSGDKVEAMAGFMVGDPRIPIDVHALHGVGAVSDKLGPELPALRAYMTKAEKLPLRGSLTDTDLYLRYEQALRDTLKEFHPSGDVNSIFAQTWEGIRAGKGLKPQGGPIDILRKKGLLERGAMLDPERLTAALKTAGWTAGSIAALLQGIGHDVPGQPGSEE